MSSPAMKFRTLDSRFIFFSRSRAWLLFQIFAGNFRKCHSKRLFTCSTNVNIRVNVGDSSTTRRRLRRISSNWLRTN